MKKQILFLAMVGLSFNLSPSASINQQLANIIDVVQALKATPTASTTKTVIPGSGSGPGTFTPPAFSAIFATPSVATISAATAANSGLIKLIIHSHFGGINVADSPILATSVLTPINSALAIGHSVMLYTNLVAQPGVGLNLEFAAYDTTTQAVIASGVFQSIMNNVTATVIPANAVLSSMSIEYQYANMTASSRATGIASVPTTVTFQGFVASTLTPAQIAANTAAINAMSSQAVATVPFSIANCSCKAPFKVINTLQGPVANATQPISCQDGLNFLNIGLTAGTGCYYAYTIFPAALLSQPALQNLIAKGMYIAFNMLQNNNVNYAQIALTDQVGNIYAQSSTALPVGMGFTQANIGFNMHDTYGAQNASRISMNGFSLSSGQRVLYQQAFVNVPAFVPPAISFISTMQVDGNVPAATAANTGLVGLILMPAFLSGNTAELHIEATFPSILASINTALQAGHTVNLYTNILAPSATTVGQDLQFAAYDVTATPQVLLGSAVFSSIRTASGATNLVGSIIAGTDAFSSMSVCYQYNGATAVSYLDKISLPQNMVSIAGYVAPKTYAQPAPGGFGGAAGPGEAQAMSEMNSAPVAPPVQTAAQIATNQQNENDYDAAEGDPYGYGYGD